MPADEVELRHRNQAVVGEVEGGVVIRMDHLRVGSERHVLTGAKRGRVVLLLARDRLAGHVQLLARFRCCPGTRAAPTGACAAGAATPLAAAAAVPAPAPVAGAARRRGPGSRRGAGAGGRGV